MNDRHSFYLGYRQGFVGNPKGFARDAEVMYQDTSESYDPLVPYIHGLWIIRAEYAEYCGPVGEGYAAIVCNPDSMTFVCEEGDVRVEKIPLAQEGDRAMLVKLIPQKIGTRIREISVNTTSTL